jgi:O-antigen/teichoic acid export membrane protein
MGFYSILTAMYTSFNVIYLGFVAGETQVGYYTTATKLYSVILGLFTAFTGVLLPRMSSLISENKIDEFRRLLGKTVNILLVFSIPIILYSLVMAPYIIKFIAGEGYEGAILPMRIVMPLIFIIGYEQILIIQALMPLREDRIVLRNSIIGASMGVLMNILLVGSFQSVGSAIVWVIAEIVVLFFAQVYLSRNKQLHFPIGEIIRNVMYNIPLFFMLIAFDKIYLYSDFLKLFYGALIMLAYTCILQIVILKNNLFILLLHKRKIDS